MTTFENKNNINEKLTLPIILENDKLKVSKNLLEETRRWINDFSTKEKGFYDLGSSINAYLEAIENGGAFTKNGSNLPAHIFKAVRIENEKNKNDSESNKIFGPFDKAILEVIKKDEEKILDFFIKTSPTVMYAHMINKDDAEKISAFFKNAKNLKLIHAFDEDIEELLANSREFANEYENDANLSLTLEYSKSDRKERQDALKNGTFDQYDEKFYKGDLEYIQDAQQVISLLVNGYRELIRKNK